MTIKLARYERVDYEFPSQKACWDWIIEQIEKFKKINGVIDEQTDRYFIRYKSEMLDTYSIAVTEAEGDYDYCKKCPETDWEGPTKRKCRCEERNMRISRGNVMDHFESLSEDL